MRSALPVVPPTPVRILGKLIRDLCMPETAPEAEGEAGLVREDSDNESDCDDFDEDGSRAARIIFADDPANPFAPRGGGGGTGTDGESDTDGEGDEEEDSEEDSEDGVEESDEAVESGDDDENGPGEGDIGAGAVGGGGREDGDDESMEAAIRSAIEALTKTSLSAPLTSSSSLAASNTIPPLATPSALDITPRTPNEHLLLAALKESRAEAEKKKKGGLAGILKGYPAVLTSDGFYEAVVEKERGVHQEKRRKEGAKVQEEEYRKAIAEWEEAVEERKGIVEGMRARFQREKVEYEAEKAAARAEERKIGWPAPKLGDLPKAPEKPKRKDFAS